METRLTASLRDTSAGRTADAILRACVHCGFCLATCPTYQLLGDELDGPRGRIYQIKQVLEGAEPTRQTQLHLDRCLTCRGCETTCPSGVEYGRLVEIGRAAVDQRVRRPWRERLYRWLLREGLTRPPLFGAALRLARAFAWALPPRLRQKVGVRRPAAPWPSRTHARKVLLPRGCTQPALSPSIDASTARVLDAIGVQAVVPAGSGCCGAIRHHLDDQGGARAEIRRNIDAWWPYVASEQAVALLFNASGCGAMVKEYAHLMRDEPAYAQKARRIVELTRDPVQLLAPELDVLRAQLNGVAPRRVAFHPPCTLQHGLRIRGEVEKLLEALGAELQPLAESHLCCGSAGPYSLLQTQLSEALRTRKLEGLLRHDPEVVLSANIGCLTHLQAGTAAPVRHWLEWLDAAMSQTGKKA